MSCLGFLDGSAIKNLPAIQETQETQVLSLGWEDPLQKGMATHSSSLASKIPSTEDPGGLHSMGLQLLMGKKKTPSTWEYVFLC